MAQSADYGPRPSALTLVGLTAPWSDAGRLPVPPGYPLGKPLLAMRWHRLTGRP